MGESAALIVANVHVDPYIHDTSSHYCASRTITSRIVAQFHVDPYTPYTPLRKVWRFQEDRRAAAPRALLSQARTAAAADYFDYTRQPGLTFSMPDPTVSEKTVP